MRALTDSRIAAAGRDVRGDFRAEILHMVPDVCGCICAYVIFNIEATAWKERWNIQAVECEELEFVEWELEREMRVR